MAVHKFHSGEPSKTPLSLSLSPFRFPSRGSLSPKYRLQCIKELAKVYIYEKKKEKKKEDTYDVLEFPRPCACARISIAARTLVHTHIYIQDMYGNAVPIHLSLSLAVLCVLARRGKHNDGERAKLRAFVRSFVWDSCWKPAIRRECLLLP